MKTDNKNPISAVSEKRGRTKQLAVAAMLTAMAYIVVLLVRIPISSVEFLKFEPKDVIIVIGGFIYGPLTSALITVAVALIEMVTISSTGIVGMLMNVISSCAFACTAAAIYKYRRTMTGAALGLVMGTLMMTGMMLLWNLIVTPGYMKYPREAVEAMLLPVFAPFNMIKGGINLSLTIMLYKPAVSALRKLRLIPAKREGSAKFNFVPILCAAVLLALCVAAVVYTVGK